MDDPAKVRMSVFLEEWKANNDLFKYHEDLKQKRIHFYVVLQGGFLAAFVALAGSRAIGSGSLWAFLPLLALPIGALAFTKATQAMDRRARAFVDTIKGKLLLIECAWKQEFPQHHFSTYIEQFDILVHRKEEVIESYLRARNLQSDPFRQNLQTRAAHVAEQSYFDIFRRIWLLAALMGFAWVIYEAQRPNKAPEPTPLLVTVRAFARPAPSSVVAHL